jgi:hypothetical protein
MLVTRQAMGDFFFYGEHIVIPVTISLPQLMNVPVISPLSQGCTFHVAKL